jgi:hypothetical protein
MHGRQETLFLLGTTIAAVLVLTPLPAVAGSPADTLAHRSYTQPKSHLSFGARYTRPQRAAISFTFVRAPGLAMTSGWFAQVEPGVGGGKLSAGYCDLALDELNPSPPSFALGLKGSVLRTWGSPLGAARHETLIGPELDMTVLYVKVSVGLLWPVGPASAHQGRLTTWGVGFGF